MKKSPRIKLKERNTQWTVLDWLALNRIFHYQNNSGAMSGVNKGKAQAT